MYAKDANTNDNKLKRIFKGFNSGIHAAQSRLDVKIRLENLRYSSVDHRQATGSPFIRSAPILNQIRSVYSSYVRRAVERELPELEVLKKKLSGNFSTVKKKNYHDPYVYDLKVLSIEDREKAKPIASIGNPDLSLATTSNIRYEVGLVEKHYEAYIPKVESRWKRVRKSATDWDFRVDATGFLTGGGVGAKIEHGSKRFATIFRQSGSHVHRFSPYRNKNLVTMLENHGSNIDLWVAHAWIANPYWRNLHIHTYADTNRKILGTGLVYQNGQKTRLQLQSQIGKNSDNHNLRIELFRSI